MNVNPSNMNAFVLYLPSMMLTMNRKGNQNSNHLTLHRRGNFIIRFMKSVKRYNAIDIEFEI